MPEKIAPGQTAGLQYRPWERLGQLGIVPLPSREMLAHINEQDTIRYQGLVLHMLTTSVVENVLVNAIQRANQTKPPHERLSIDPNIT